MSKLINTDFPRHLKTHINNGERTILVIAGTGEGKSVAISLVMSQFSHTHNCLYLGVYRMVTKSLCNYLREIGGSSKFHYIMRNDRSFENAEDAKNSSILMTAGYWIETIVGGLHKYYKDKSTIIFIDEVHDTSRETCLSLRLCMWLQNKYSNITVILASATMNMDSVPQLDQRNPVTIRYQRNEQEKDSKISVSRYIQLEEAEMKFNSLVKVIYLNEPLSDPNYLDDIIEIVAQRVAEVDTDILIILPGKKEIENLVYKLEKLNMDQMNQVTIYTLHSETPREDSDACLNYRGRRIIVATNMVQNSITLPNTHTVIDSCLRRLPYMDREGIMELRTVSASKSDIIQASGRVGRLGPGHDDRAYLMITKEDYHKLPNHHPSDFDRSPLYYPLIKLIRGNLPYREILSDIKSQVIDADLDYLIDHGIIEREDDGFYLSPIGKIVSQLQLSVKSGIMVAHCILDKNVEDIYHVTLIACFIDLQGSLFYHPARKPRESIADYTERVEHLKIKQQELIKSDSVTTTLNIWHNSFIDYSGTIDRGVYSPKLWELNANHKSVLNVCKKILKIKSIESPAHDDCLLLLDEIKHRVTSYIEKTFSSWKMKFIGRGYVPLDIQPGQMIRKTILDKKLMVNSDNGQLIIPLSIRLISSNFAVISKFVSLENTISNVV